MKTAIFLPLLLVGCSSMQDNVDRYVARQNALEATCMSYGVERHSQGMLDCKQRLEQPQPTDYSFASGLRAGAGVLSPGVYAADNPGYVPPPAYSPPPRVRRQPVNCTANTVYGQTNVTCY